MNFTDRQSTNPGRYKITPENGDPYYAVLERADGVIVDGTPLSAATFNAMIRKLREYADARNLLDNSNFAHPVNQRGKQQYSGAAQYTVDRWRAASMIEVSMEDGYVGLSCSDAAATRNGFTQDLAEGKIPDPGTPVTVAFEDEAGNVLVGTTLMPENGYVSLFGTTGPGVNLYHSSATEARLSVMIPAGMSIGIKWIAAYEGEFTAGNLPAYRPKDFSAELMECMRYYQVRSTGNVNPLDLRPTMRATPTVTALSSGYAYSADL